MEFGSVYKQYLAQKNVLNWQFYNQNVVKCKKTSSTQNNIDETKEQKDFHVEKIKIAKETTDDGNVKEIIKKEKDRISGAKNILKKFKKKN